MRRVRADRPARRRIDIAHRAETAIAAETATDALANGDVAQPRSSLERRTSRQRLAIRPLAWNGCLNFSARSSRYADRSSGRRLGRGAIRPVRCPTRSTRPARWRRLARWLARNEGIDRERLERSCAARASPGCWICKTMTAVGRRIIATMQLVAVRRERRGRDGARPASARRLATLGSRCERDAIA